MKWILSESCCFFGLMKRDQKERQNMYLLLVKRYHLERWV